MQNCLAVGVEPGKVVDDGGGKVVSPEALLDQGVGDGPKGVLQVKEGHVDSPSLLPGILHDFLHSHIVLYAPIYSWQEGLLHRGVNELVGEEEGGEPGVEEEVEGLANAAAMGDHP